MKRRIVRAADGARVVGREGLLTALVVVVCVLSLGYHASKVSPPPRDGIDQMLKLYERVAADLPRGGRVGYLSAIADPTAAAAAQFVAQHALAPRILEVDLRDLTVVLTSPGADSSLDHDPRLDGFELHLLQPGGVRVYRRRPS